MSLRDSSEYPEWVAETIAVIYEPSSSFITEPNPGDCHSFPLDKGIVGPLMMSYISAISESVACVPSSMLFASNSSLDRRHPYQL
jgi:hypothetical protein